MAAYGRRDRRSVETAQDKRETSMKKRFFGVCGAGLAVAAMVPGVASGWAPASSATIHPGVQTITAGAQCTSNFIYSDGSNVYLGQAAHCSGTGGNTATDGCTSGSRPLGTSVQISGASKPGTMVYNSWLTMQGLHEGDANTCAFNDLALVKVDPADVSSVNPSVPGFGGPTGLGTAAQGDTVYSYGNSELRLGISQLSPKQGIVATVDGNGWSYNVYTLSPGIPGDSGSGFLNASGQAIGVLSTLDLAPTPGSNGVGNLANELNYMHAHSSFGGVSLVAGTQAFNGNVVSAISNASAPAAGSPVGASSRRGLLAGGRTRTARKRHRASSRVVRERRLEALKTA
jgi:hypothetical protein